MKQVATNAVVMEPEVFEEIRAELIELRQYKAAIETKKAREKPKKRAYMKTYMRNYRKRLRLVD